ncbi:hypothetical protein MHYP_G00005340 [Metynnis hypsauchen]
MDCEVGLLIGYDCSRALAPRQVITGGDDEPYAIKTDLGWSIVGSSPWVAKSTEVTGLCHRVSVKELPPVTPAAVIRALESDFRDTNPGDKSISQDDIQFMHLLNERIHQNADGHLEMPLPFKTRPRLPENKRLALVRLKHLKRKFEKNPKFKSDYFKFMEGVFKDAIRGAVRQIRSDQGTNFVGAKNELTKTLKEVDKDRLTAYLAEKQCDFTMNVPDASHMGGVWERQIRTVRSVLSWVLSQSAGRLDDASLRTFFYEAMSIVNSRPLTTDNINDPKGLEPLTPNHLLTMKACVPLPPPGKFVAEDLYAKKRWRRVQYLTEQFWGRWRKEYLTNITLRQRWQSPRRNVKIGDIVIVKEEGIPRNDWRLGRVLDVCKDEDGLVRKATIQMGNRKLGKDRQQFINPTILERPIHKLVVIVENN